MEIEGTNKRCHICCLQNLGHSRHQIRGQKSRKWSSLCPWSPNTKIFFFYLLIYVWLCWVFVSVRGLSLIAASGDHSSSRCVGLSLSRPLLLQSTGSRRAGSVAVAHGPSCYAACGIFPDQGLNPCPLHWQADSQPLCHQGSPKIFKNTFMCVLEGMVFALFGKYKKMFFLMYLEKWS